LNLSECNITNVALKHLQFMPLQSLNLACTEITDDGIFVLQKKFSRHLDQNKNKQKHYLLDHNHYGSALTALNLFDTGLTDKGMKYLSQIRSLTSLKFGGSDSQITNKGLQHLAQITNLRSLQFRCPEINGDGFQPLTSLRLQELRVWDDNRYVDKWLHHIKGITSLRDLNLCCSHVTDDGLEQIQNLVNLQRVNLKGCFEVTSAGLRHLSGLPIRSLDLTGCPIKDAALEHLRYLPLEELFVSRTEISNAGVQVVLSFLSLKRVCLAYNPQLTKKQGISELRKKGIKVHFTENQVGWSMMPHCICNSSEEEE